MDEKKERMKKEKIQEKLSSNTERINESGYAASEVLNGCQTKEHLTHSFIFRLWGSSPQATSPCQF